MLVDEVQPPLLRRCALLRAFREKTRQCLLAAFLGDLANRIVVLVNVQCEEMRGGEVSLAGGAPVGVRLGVVDVEGFQGVEV